MTIALQNYFPISMGCMVQNSTFTDNLNATGTWLAFKFNISRSCTLRKIKFCTATTHGTIGANDIEVHIFSDAGSAPGTSLANVNSFTGGAISGSGWKEAVGFNFGITPGDYWVVIKNVNATPATNYIGVYAFYNNIGQQMYLGQTKYHGSAYQTTTNSGSTWSTGSDGAFASIRLEFNEGFKGFPIYSGITTNVYNNIEAGSFFNIPANICPNIASISMMGVCQGSPAGNLAYKIYDKVTNTLIGTTQSLPYPNMLSGGTNYPVNLGFSTPIALTAGQAIRVVATNTNTTTDNSSNCYKIGGYQMDSDINSLNLIPLRMSQCVSSNGGSTWDDTQTVKFTTLMLNIDTSTPFAVPAGTIIQTNQSPRSRIPNKKGLITRF